MLDFPVSIYFWVAMLKIKIRFDVTFVSFCFLHWRNMSVRLCVRAMEGHIRKEVSTWFWKIEETNLLQKSHQVQIKNNNCAIGIEKTISWTSTINLSEVAEADELSEPEFIDHINSAGFFPSVSRGIVAGFTFNTKNEKHPFWFRLCLLWV